MSKPPPKGHLRIHPRVRTMTFAEFCQRFEKMLARPLREDEIPQLRELLDTLQRGEPQDAQEPTP